MNDLAIISKTEFNSNKDYRDFAKYIKRCWHEGYGRAILHRNYLTLITGGWSNNEEVQIAVDRNQMFNMVCWKKSERGGLVQYELPKLK